MKLELKVIRQTPNGLEERHFAIETDSLLVGKDSQELRLSGKISSLHLMLYQGLRGELRVRDLGSKEGTFVGDEVVEDRAIGQGYVIRAGEYALAITGFTPDRSVVRPALVYSASRRISAFPEPVKKKAPERVVPGPQSISLKGR